MPSQEEYKRFTENDFITDRYFQDWVINKDNENELFWNNFFETNPAQKEAGEIARIFLLNLRFKEDLPDESLIRRAFAKHLDDIEQLESSKVINIRRSFSLKKLVRVAAIFGGVLLVLTALLIFNKEDKSVLVKTDYGNLKSLVLPDSSQVVLNANSTIKFNKKWNKNTNREVWLKGEAFFNVRHLNKDSSEIQKYEQFIVHTEELTVEVLGTAFDIRQRRERTEVVLETGKIKVSFADKETKDIIMKPGDKLVYNANGAGVIKTTTSAEDFSAWRERKLILDDPTVAEIVEYLEDNFGKHIVLEGSELGKRKIAGPILLTNLDDALFILSTVLNTEIIKKDRSIIIRPR
jgi:transmembrane sensor